MESLLNDFRPGEDDFLREVRGVVHVGDNIGQKRGIYQELGLEALWIEPDPGTFAKLEDNLRSYPGQHALKALITDEDGDEHDLNVSNNNQALVMDTQGSELCGDLPQPICLA